MKDRVRLSFREEAANSIVHGIMAIITLLGIPAVAIIAWNRGGMTQAVGVSIFMVSIFLMFLTSTLYHSMDYDSKHKLFYRTLDHICIYFAIAGTYTPVALKVIGGWEGICLVIVQWTMVLAGIIYKSTSRKSMPKVSLTIYLVMGWSAVLFLPTLIRNASVEFITLIVVGGILYSIGAAIYAMKGFNYHHLAWHLFIIMAVAAHFISIAFMM